VDASLNNAPARLSGSMILPTAMVASCNNSDTSFERSVVVSSRTSDAGTPRARIRTAIPIISLSSTPAFRTERESTLLFYHQPRAKSIVPFDRLRENKSGENTMRQEPGHEIVL
jgi:hypothetical protein